MKRKPNIFNQSPQQSEEEQWISLSDLMTGLMLIFMLIAIAYMIKNEGELQQKKEEIVQQQKEREKLKHVAEIYDQVRHQLYADLMAEFGKDLPVWDAEITEDLVFRFNNPDILFTTGAHDLKPNFQTILRNFFPRYARIITAEKYHGNIEEVRIEGHTSSLWSTRTTTEEAYFLNMDLSQSRTRSALRFVLRLPEIQPNSQWLRKHLTANGLSSSQPIKLANGEEDIKRSQRVEFHIRTNSQSWLANIKDALQ